MSEAQWLGCFAHLMEWHGWWMLPIYATYIVHTYYLILPIYYWVVLYMLLYVGLFILVQIYIGAPWCGPNLHLSYWIGPSTGIELIKNLPPWRGIIVGYWWLTALITGDFYGWVMPGISTIVMVCNGSLPDLVLWYNTVTCHTIHINNYFDAYCKDFMMVPCLAFQGNLLRVLPANMAAFLPAHVWGWLAPATAPKLSGSGPGGHWGASRPWILFSDNLPVVSGIVTSSTRTD